MSKKPTAMDAQLILHLYDLRREAEMRKARSWWIGEFWPQSAEDFLKVAWAMGSQENNWLRQVGGYWSVARTPSFSPARVRTPGCGRCSSRSAPSRPSRQRTPDIGGSTRALSSVKSLMR